MNFLRLVQAEFLKTKSFPFPLFFIILTILSITIAFSSFYSMTHVEFLHQSLDINPNPWYAYYFKGYLFFFVFFFPAIVSITTYVIKSIEDRADAWKRLLVLPYNRFLLHSSKLMVIYSFVTFYLIITFILLVLSGFLLSVLKHDFNFKNYDTYHPFLFIFFVKFEIAALAICTFSYAYMIVIRRTTVSLLLSIFIPFIALTFTNQYSSPLYQFFSFFRLKHQMIVNKSFDYNMIALNWISGKDVLCFVIIAISLGVIIHASRKPMINYE